MGQIWKYIIRINFLEKYIKYLVICVIFLKFRQVHIIIEKEFNNNQNQSII
jgi:hypothetical protein